jgi:undecaprenyl-diphosphatase
MLSLSYWLWHKKNAQYLIYGLFATVLLNITLKDMFHECRPPVAYWLTQVQSSSFPSGHAQTGLMVWGGLAYYVQHRILSILLLGVGLLIALSRCYLGVHYPHDIVAGSLLGLGMIYLTAWFNKTDCAPMKHLALSLQLMMVICLSLLFVILVKDPDKLSLVVPAASVGFWLGCQWEKKYLDFSPPQNSKNIIRQISIGLSGIALLYFGLNLGVQSLDTDSSWIKCAAIVQYFLLGLWIAYGAPALVHKKLETKI